MREPTREEIEIVDAWRHRLKVEEVNKELESYYRDDIEWNGIPVQVGCGLSEKGIIGFAAMIDIKHREELEHCNENLRKLEERDYRRYHKHI